MCCFKTAHLPDPMPHTVSSLVGDEEAGDVGHAARDGRRSDVTSHPEHSQPPILDLNGLHPRQGLRVAARGAEISDGATGKGVVGLDHLLVALDGADHKEDLVEAGVGDHANCVEGGRVRNRLKGGGGRRGDVAAKVEVVDLGEPAEVGHHGDPAMLKLSGPEPRHTLVVKPLHQPQRIPNLLPSLGEEVASVGDGCDGG
mmetsp:Transcript_9806/g.19895  ORF Transcript_9806/g.19895 Transcript_9806/m.19895 type:complete len:200 (+) Transcript_9806:63-662(+)